MSAGRAGEETDPEAAARGHAARIVAGDRAALDDLGPGAEVTPPHLLAALLGQGFRGAEVVAHARIGAHHILKTKFVGPATVVVQARWAAEPGGRWLIREAEIARVEGERAGALEALLRPGEP